MTDVVINIVFGDFAFGGEPNIRKTFGVADTLFKDADDVGSAADMGVDQTIDELGRAGLAFGVKTVKSCLEAFEVNGRRIFVGEQQAQIVGIAQPRHDNEWLTINYAMMWDIGSGQITGPENSFVNEISQRVVVDSMAWTDPADRALAGYS